jgi:hypothetical protein
VYPDPTTLGTEGAIAVLTERVGNLADTVSHLTGAVEKLVTSLPPRMQSLEEHDAEQDASIKAAMTVASEALDAVRAITDAVETACRIVRLVVKTVGVASVIVGIVVGLRALKVV